MDPSVNGPVSIAGLSPGAEAVSWLCCGQFHSALSIEIHKYWHHTDTLTFVHEQHWQEVIVIIVPSQQQLYSVVATCNIESGNFFFMFISNAL